MFLIINVIFTSYIKNISNVGECRLGRVMSEYYDVIIIGGGVAGLSTAANITDEKVLLLEKDRIKTEEKKYLRFTYMDAVERLGLSNSIIQKYDKLSLRTITNEKIEVSYYDDVLALVDLGKLHHNLKNYVEKKQEIREKSKVVDVKQYDDKLELKVLADGSEKIFYSKYLVDASGVNFFTRKKFNLTCPNFYCHCLESTNEGGYIGDEKTLTFVVPSERFKFGICIFPYEMNNYSIGLTDSSKLLSTPKKRYKEFIEQTKKNLGFDDILYEGEISNHQMGVLPMGLTAPMTFGRVCYVGDVLSQIAPWMVEGVRPIVEASIMCSDAVSSAFKNQDVKLLEKYSNDWNSTYGEIYNRLNIIDKWNRTTDVWLDSFKQMSKMARIDKVKFLRFLEYDQMSKKAEMRLLNLKSMLE